MNNEHLPRTCKWASPTLFLNWPLWLDAWSWEWSCYRHSAYRPVMTQEDCRACPRWEARGTEDGAGSRCEPEYSSERC
jgi:hypothetical protein